MRSVGSAHGTNVYRIALDQAPPGLVEALRPVLEAQGSPPITASRQDGLYVFESHTTVFMLRCRVADALDGIYPAWRDHSL
jgi:hypothetical protein